jgi:hypothetical protein
VKIGQRGGRRGEREGGGGAGGGGGGRGAEPSYRFYSPTHQTSRMLRV